MPVTKDHTLLKTTDPYVYRSWINKSNKYRILMNGADPEKYRSWIRESRKFSKHSFRNYNVSQTREGLVASFYTEIDAFVFLQMFWDDVDQNLGKAIKNHFEFCFDVKCSKTKLREWVKQYFKGIYRINACAASIYSTKTKEWCKIECTYEDVHMFKMFPFESDPKPYLSRCLYMQTMMNYVRMSQSSE